MIDSQINWNQPEIIALPVWDEIFDLNTNTYKGITDTSLKLAPNFTAKELLIGNEDAKPSAYILINLIMLTQKLQVIRDLYGATSVNSGYRTFEHNESVQLCANPDYIPNSSKSLHMLGMAADIVMADMSPRELQKLLKNWCGGMGCYKTFTHLDIRSYRARW